MHISTNPEWEKNKMKDYYKVISQYTDYDIIEVELKDKFYESHNGIVGVQVVRYTKKNNNGPGKRKQVFVNQKVVGGEMNFVEHPFEEGPTVKEGGSGEIVYLINDREPTPRGSLSGEQIGWNLEFLATHYDNDCPFIIKDPKWRDIVAKRRAKIEENITPRAHVFDDKYRVRGGMGERPTNEVIVKTESAVEVEALKKQIAALTKLVEKQAETPKPSAPKSPTLKKRARKQKEQEEPKEEVEVVEVESEESIKANFGA